jgi:hypothetical protein
VEVGYWLSSEEHEPRQLVEDARHGFLDFAAPFIDR